MNVNEARHAYNSEQQTGLDGPKTGSRATMNPVPDIRSSYDYNC